MNFKFLKILRAPDEGVLDLLNRNIIGTPGLGMLYQHLGVANKIGKIAKPFFVNLMRGANIIGTCCFCLRQTSNAGNTIKSFYIRYFSFRDAFRRKSPKQKSLSRNSALRAEVDLLLHGNGLDTSATEKFFHYAYVDPRNVRSASLCTEFGFETVRQYATLIFSRLNPKKYTEQKIAETTGADEASVKELLANFYREYNMFSFENLFEGRKYYVIKDENGSIIAGIQANADKWKILALPGFSGKLILHLFSNVPILRKLISKNYRFLTIEGIYYRQGSENKLAILLEHLLALHEVNSAIMVVDAGSTIYHDLRNLELGPVEKLNKEVKGNVICRFFNFSKQEKINFYSKPAYISGIDVT